MVKPPRTRHSKPSRPPLVIEGEALPGDPIASAQDQNEDIGPFESSVDHTAADRAAHPASEPVEEPVEDRVEAETAGTGGYSPYHEPSAAGRSQADEQTAVPPYATPKQAPQRVAGPSSVAAGLIGAICALILAGLLQYAGVLGSFGRGDAALRSDVVALKSDVAAVKQNDPAATIAGLSDSVAQLKTDVSALQSNPGDQSAIEGLDGRIKQLEATVTSQQAGASSQQVDDLNAKLTSLEQSVAALSGKVGSQSIQPKAAVAIAGSGLKAALERGGPFATELDTFAAVEPSAPELAELRKFAGAGVITAADIVRQFPDAADAMVAAATPPNADSGFVNRLWNSAASVVKARPVGDAQGDEPAARIARMELAFQQGDENSALAEYAALPSEVQAAGASLMDRVKARVSVEQLVDKMIANALKAA